MRDFGKRSFLSSWLHARCACSVEGAGAEAEAEAEVLPAPPLLDTRTHHPRTTSMCPIRRTVTEIA